MRVACAIVRIVDVHADRNLNLDRQDDSFVLPFCVCLNFSGAHADRVLITCDGQPVWQHGAYVPGTLGIVSAFATNTTVALRIGSGVYSFDLTDEA
jgi:hypothetical protein